MSGLNSLLLHVVVITPVCQYIFSRFPKPRNLLFACGFLAAVALAGEVSEWQSRPPNYYHVLSVDRAASPADLKKAYRDATLRFHPDKNKSPDAASRFQAATEAYETLSDQEMRKLYERFGPEAVKDARARAVHSAKGETDTLLSLAGFYLLWGVLTYLLTLGKSRGQARTWSFVGLIVALFVEFQMTLGGWDPLGGVLTRTTIREKVGLVHSLYPAFMHGCCLLSQFTYVDLDALQLLMMQTLLQQQRELGDLLRHVVQCVDKKHGASIAAAGGVTEQSAAAAAAGGGAAGGVAGEEAALSLAQRIKRQEAATQRAMQEAQQKQGKGGLPSWVIMIGMYVVFNYLLK